MMAFSDADFAKKVIGFGEPRSVLAGPVTANMCSVLGVQPKLGRCFSAEEEATKAPVTLLSHRLWQTLFAGDPNAVGRTLTIDDAGRDSALTIVGVMPEGFRFYWVGYDMWVPEPLDGRTFGWGSILGRLKPGVTIPQALEEARILQRNVLPTRHEEAGGMRLAVQTLQDEISADTRPGLWALASAAAIVLLIACANVASLLLGRGVERTRELAVRQSLGASRIREVSIGYSELQV